MSLSVWYVFNKRRGEEMCSLEENVKLSAVFIFIRNILSTFRRRRKKSRTIVIIMVRIRLKHVSTQMYLLLLLLLRKNTNIFIEFVKHHL